MKAPDQTPTVELVGEDGNAFAIMAKVRAALIDAGADEEYVQKYDEDSMSGDYDHLLGVAMEYANIA